MRSWMMRSGRDNRARARAVAPLDASLTKKPSFSSAIRQSFRTIAFPSTRRMVDGAVVFACDATLTRPGPFNGAQRRDDLALRLFDGREQLPAALQDIVQKLALLIRQWPGLAIAQQLGETDDGTERRTQVVEHLVQGCSEIGRAMTHDPHL